MPYQAERTHLTKKALSELWEVSESTVSNRIREIEKLEGERYPHNSVIRDGRCVYVARYVYEDYITHRGLLQDTNGYKHVPLYDPAKIARNNVDISYIVGDDRLSELVDKKVKEALSGIMAMLSDNVASK